MVASMTGLIARLAAYLAAALALSFCLYLLEQIVEGRGYDRARAEDVADLAAQKVEAARVLAAETAKTLKAQGDLANFISKLETDRETLQAKNRADLRVRSAGPRLQFAAEAVGCGAGAGDTQGEAPGAAGDAAPAVVELPRQIGDDLWQLAGDAESLAIDYGVLWRYVHNPGLVCELRSE